MAQAMMIGAMVASTVGTIVSANQAASAAKAEGKQAEKVGEWQASQLRQRAGQERAAAQRQAIEERRQGDLAVSRARALSAGSGASASDTTVMNIYSDLAAEGEQNAMTALWEGEEAAKGLEMQAAGAQYEGAAAAQAGKFQSTATKRAGYLSGVGTAMSYGADFYSKYAPTDFGSGTGSTTGNHPVFG